MSARIAPPAGGRGCLRLSIQTRNQSVQTVASGGESCRHTRTTPGVIRSRVKVPSVTSPLRRTSPSSDSNSTPAGPGGWTFPSIVDHSLPVKMRRSICNVAALETESMVRCRRVVVHQGVPDEDCDLPLRPSTKGRLRLLDDFLRHILGSLARDTCAHIRPFVVTRRGTARFSGRPRPRHRGGGDRSSAAIPLHVTATTSLDEDISTGLGHPRLTHLISTAANKIAPRLVSNRTLAANRESETRRKGP